MKLTLIAYAIIAIVTFGYAASSTDSCKQKPWEGILQVSECRFMIGWGSGMAWPLYWSWEAFDAGRQALATSKGGEG